MTSVLKFATIEMDPESIRNEAKRGYKATMEATRTGQSVEKVYRKLTREFAMSKAMPKKTGPLDKESALDFVKEARGRHGGAGKKQVFLQHRVRAIKRKGLSNSQAFAIATAKGQDEGIYRPGTRTLTPKGRKAEARHKRED